MGIVEAGQDEAAGGVENSRPGANQGSDLRV
jgi:hypothetical protein